MSPPLRWEDDKSETPFFVIYWVGLDISNGGMVKSVAELVQGGKARPIKMACGEVLLNRAYLTPYSSAGVALPYPGRALALPTYAELQPEKISQP